MKKLIISAISATALLFGFASCSGDLHDMNDAPIVEVPTKIVGAMNYDGGNVFSDMVKVDELTSTYTFIYSAGMSAQWNSPSDGVAFKVGYEKDNWNTCWSQETKGDTTVADGKGEVVCKAQSSENISFAGLTDGKTYKITAKAGVASVTVSIEKADDIPSYTLNANGILHSMSYTADGEKGIYKATITPTSDTLELNFFDGTNNYGSSTEAIDVSGKDTDDNGAIASNPAVIGKLSTTMTTPAKFTGIKKVDSSKFYNYIVVLTIDGDVTTATITRVIPVHEVTYIINVSGYTENDVAYLGGNLIDKNWEPWPFKSWTEARYKNGIENKSCWATADSEGKVSFKRTGNFEDGKARTDVKLIPTKVSGSGEDFSCEWQTGDIAVPAHSPLSGKNTTFTITVKLTEKNADGKMQGSATISEAIETPSTN